jgi:AhpD family alkylhydroperoxidase
MTVTSATTQIPVRLDFGAFAADFARAMAHLDRAATKELDKAEIGPWLRELIRIRASQLNGCAYCMDMHTKDARAIGETEGNLIMITARRCGGGRPRPPDCRAASWHTPGWRRGGHPRSLLKRGGRGERRARPTPLVGSGGVVPECVAGGGGQHDRQRGTADYQQETFRFDAGPAVGG